MRIRPFNRWLIIALMLVLVGTGIYMFLPFLIDEDQYRRTMETGLSLALGRRVDIKGPIRLTFSWNPTLVLEDVRIANPSWASHPLFLKATRLEAQLALLPLMDRRFVVHKLFFDGVELYLEEGPNELNNCPTTLGYGDLTPVKPIARTVGYQAIVGQFYVAVLVAWLVGMYLSGKNQNR